ncbi:hypothetical protein WMF37_01920 [Sorangium sp. So ce291]|uniref:hypothetical protein n=1 Tax=Sorangium sp. So ce291 TaxID=3133294 RepID=UPI003F61AE49
MHALSPGSPGTPALAGWFLGCPGAPSPPLAPSPATSSARRISTVAPACAIAATKEPLGRAASAARAATSAASDLPSPGRNRKVSGTSSGPGAIKVLTCPGTLWSKAPSAHAPLASWLDAMLVRQGRWRSGRHP